MSKSHVGGIISDIIDDINQSNDVSDNLETDSLFLSDRLNYNSHGLTKDNFHHLENFVSKKSMVFIDGGSSEIIYSNSLSLYLVRIAYVKYNGFECTKKGTEDFFVHSKYDATRGKLKLVSSVIPLSKNKIGTKLYFDVDDETLCDGLANVKISKLGGVIRRLFELKFARQLIDDLSPGDIIVLDGSLQSMVTYEKTYVDSLLDKAQRNEVLITALSKTSSMLTNSGKSLSVALDEFTSDTDFEKQKWFYHPLVDFNDDDYIADLSIVKLHKRAKNYFVLEMNKRQKYVHREKVIGYLSMLSSDPVFFGYPYPLIKVDELARVTNEDANYIRMRFAQGLDVDSLEKDANAHAILDSIKF